MTYDWTPTPGTGHIDPSSSAWLRPDGGVTLALSRWTGCALTYRMVADADGPVHSAILELPSSTDCTLGSNRSLNEGHVVYTAFENSKPTKWGAVGGDIDSLLPQTYRSYVDGIGQDYIAGSLGLFEWSSSSILSWDLGASLGRIVLSGADSALQPGAFVMSNGALFFTLSQGGTNHARIAVYTTDSGVIDLIDANADPSMSSMNLGTDGKDLVWAQASRLNATPGTPFSSLVWVTAPFATTVAALHPRSVRTESTYDLRGSFVVGCGYAATSIYGPPDLVGIRLLRLSDGQSWSLTTHYGTDPWTWARPVAVSCTELFAIVQNGENNIARVSIASLGAGEPMQ